MRHHLIRGLAIASLAMLLGASAPAFADGEMLYPALVYRAARYPATGKVLVLHPLAGTGDAVADAFSVRNYKTVTTPDEHDQANREGWSDSPLLALEAFERAAKEEADLAANAAYHAQRMTDKARAEFDAAQEAAAPGESAATPPRQSRTG